MCTGKCSKCIGVSLYPFSLICIIANIILFFPGWSVDYLQYPGRMITPEVRNLGGIVGGGILVLLPAIQIQATGRKGCCNNRWGMLFSILFAAIGVGGGAFCLVMSVIGMTRGPVCRYDPNYNSSVSLNDTEWGRPFELHLTNFSTESYLFNKDRWSECIEPVGVVEFNIILFSILLAAGGIEMILCFIQMLNGLFGCICGTGQKEKSKKGEKGEKGEKVDKSEKSEKALEAEKSLRF
ncbi:transmembrane 4 L6 family member 1-like [Discoglossus pictus]